MSYIVRQTETEIETQFETAEQVCDLLDRLAADESADFFVLIDRGVRPSWLKRFLGLSERLVSPCFSLEKAGDVAVLTFLDDAWSEHRAIDPERPAEVSEKVRLKLSGGDPTPADPDVCMAAPRAFAAARESLRSGARPDWLTYRYVR